MNGEQRLVQDAVFSSRWKVIHVAEKATGVPMTLKRGSVGRWILEGEKFTRKCRQESILGGGNGTPRVWPLHSCQGPGTGTGLVLYGVRAHGWVGWNSRGRPGLDHASVSLAKETLPYGSGQPEGDFVLLLTTSDLQRRA